MVAITKPRTSPVYLISADRVLYINLNLVPRLSIMRGQKKRAWYQMHTHALDIASFIPSVTVSSMNNDVFTKDDLLQHHKPRPVP